MAIQPAAPRSLTRLRRWRDQLVDFDRVRRPYRVNWRFVGLSVLVAGLLAGGVFGLHRAQASNQRQGLLDRAQRAEQQQDWVTATGYYRMYLNQRPADQQVLHKLARAYARRPLSGAREHERAWLTIERVLVQVAADDVELRERAVDLALALGQARPAEAHLVVLTRARPQDAELMLKLAEVRMLLNEVPAAAEAFRATLKIDPAQLLAYSRLATIMQADPAQKEHASALFDEAVNANPGMANALLLRANHRWSVGDRAGALADVAAAEALQPDSSEVLIARTRLTLASLNDASRRKSADSEQVFTHLLDRLETRINSMPEEGNLYQLLADVHLARGHIEPALAALERGCKAVPGDYELRWQWVWQLLRLDRAEAAEAQLQLLRQNRLDEPRTAFLEAALLATRREWARARDAFQAVRPRLLSHPQLQVDGDLLLARCFRELGLADQEVQAYSRVISLDRLNMVARMARADALARQGRMAAAAAAYAEVTQNAEQAPAEAWLKQLRVLAIQAARRDTDAPDWRRLDEVLTALKTQLPDQPIVILAEAEVEGWRGRFAEAKSVLEAGVARFPDFTPLRLALVQVLAHLDDDAAAEALLAELEAKSAPALELLGTRLRIIGMRPKEQATTALTALEAQLASADVGTQRTLAPVVEQTWRQLDQPEAAHRWLMRQSELNPSDVQVALLALRAALDRSEPEQVTALLERLAKLDSAAYAFGQALNLAKTGGEAALPQLRVLLATAIAQRPIWPDPLVLRGEIEVQAGNANAALDSFIAAIELGANDFGVIRQVMQLLSQSGRSDRAQRVLTLIERQLDGRQKREIGQLAATVLLRGGDSMGAMSWAERTVREETASAMDWVWLGTMRRQVNDRRAAETAFRRALELDESLASAWLGLLGVVPREQAGPILKEALTKLDAQRDALAISYAYENAGDPAQAVAVLTRRIQAGDPDGEFQVALARLHLRQARPDLAEPMLRELLTHSSAQLPARLAALRRDLAQCLATRGTPAARREALALIATNLEGGWTIEDERMRIVLLSLAGRYTERTEAIRLLRGLVDRDRASGTDRYLLSRLLFLQGQRGAARDMLQTAMALQTPTVDDVILNIELSLADDQLADAQLWMRELQNARAAPAVVGQYHARVALAQGDVRAATASIRSAFATLPEAQAAAALDELRELRTRINHLRYPDVPKQFLEEVIQLAGTRSDRPLIDLRRALLQADLGQFDAALQIVDRHRQVPATAALALPVAVEIAAMLERADPRMQQIRQWIEAAAGQEPPPASPTAPATMPRRLLAAMLAISGDHAAARAMYQHMVDAGDLSAVNNLAHLLKLEGQAQAQQAVALLDQVIEASGPTATLLDTRGLALLAAGRLDEAAHDLHDAALVDAGPGPWFHRALLLARQRDMAGARAAFDQALARGLSRATLVPFEREAFAELSAMLERKSPSR